MCFKDYEPRNEGKIKTRKEDLDTIDVIFRSSTY